MKLVSILLISFLSSMLLMAAVPTEVEVTGYVSALSEKSVYVTGKHGVVIEVPRSEVSKALTNIRTGEYISVNVEKSKLKATMAKNFLTKR